MGIERFRSNFLKGLIENSNLEDWNCTNRREKDNLCGELEMRNRLYQESHTRSCQEIEE